MFQRIDFENTEPFFVTDNGSKWYFDPYFQKYIREKQGENLPKLSNKINACIAHNPKEDFTDFVLMEGNDILRTYHYNNEGFEQMEAFINILKIDKHFKENEKRS